MNDSALEENACTVFTEERPAQPETIEARLAEIESQLASLQATRPDPNGINLVVFEGYRDRLLAAFVMATGAAAVGMQVNMFFTFWGTAALRKGGPSQGKKSIVERAFGILLPRSPSRTKLSQLNMGGIGSALMTLEMKKKNVADLDELIATAAELGVRINVCEMSMHLMGIHREELIDYPHLGFCGVASFVDQTSCANTTLFI